MAVLQLSLVWKCDWHASSPRVTRSIHCGGGAEIKWRFGYASLAPNSDHVVSMSLLRYVRQDYFSPRLLSVRWHRRAPPTAVRRRWGASFERQWSSSVAEDREHSTDDVALKSVEDLPTPGNTWNTLQDWLFPTEYQHENQLEASLSTGKLYRVPIPFFGRHLVTTSSPKHVSEIFRNEGEVPCRVSLEHFEQFMVKKGFIKGIVIS